MSSNIERAGFCEESSALNSLVPGAIEVDSASDSDYDSLFDGDAPDSPTPIANQPVARRLPLRIPGLFFDPSIEIPPNLADDLWRQCTQMFFRDPNVNQIMLFERARLTMEPNVVEHDDKNRSPDCDRSCSPTSPRTSSSSGLPRFLTDLLGVLEDILRDCLPSSTHSLLFPSQDTQTLARQVILNHYRPGEGISPHVDLVGRYGDGIIGVSLRSGCAMRFAKVYPGGEAESQCVPSPPLISTNTAAGGRRYQDGGVDGRNLDNRGPSQVQCTVNDPAISRDISFEIEDIQHLYLPARSVLVLTEDARYRWTHGIEKLSGDFVESENEDSTVFVPRGERLSITFRWLLPGADVVGHDEE